jgi:hypothetical protein
MGMTKRTLKMKHLVDCHCIRIQRQWQPLKQQSSRARLIQIPQNPTRCFALFASILSLVIFEQVEQAHQRLHLKTIMASPAIHWAQNYLIEQGDPSVLLGYVYFKSRNQRCFVNGSCGLGPRAPHQART